MEFICKYCGKECKNSNSLRNHERLCQKNPGHQTTVFQTNNPQKINAWNKGLSAETDARIKRLTESVHNYYKTHAGTQTGRPRTAEEKKKISSTMKLNGKSGGIRTGSGRGHKGHYKGYYCDSTYELVWTIYCLDHNIQFKRCKLAYEYTYKNEKHKYYPDYEMSDGSLVEIKGYHNEVVDLKTASVKDRLIKVLYKKDLKEMFDYVEQNYQYTELTDLYD